MAVDVGTAVAYLNLDTTAFNSALSQVKDSLNTFSDDTSTAADKWMGVGGTLTNIGNGLTNKVTIPLANLGVSAIQNAIDFESAFAGVKKTINEFGEGNTLESWGASWDDLAQGIKEIAYETGISVEEIAGVMEIAGQLGIEIGKSGEGIIEFTRQMALMGVTTDMTAADAALAIAKFMNITGVSVGEVKNLTAAIVELGNSYATQENDIVQMSLRLASAGKAAGLSAQNILALSTAISSAGIKTEAGASSMSTTLSKLTRYTVRWRQVMNGTYQGTEGDLEELTAKMQAIGKASDMSADEFTKAWEKSPVEALTLFISGLATADERGENMILLLNDMGMNAIRESNNLRALAFSFENMFGTIEDSDKAWNEASAMEEEAGKRFETLESRIGQLNERWKEVKREIAENLIPILERLMDTAQNLIDKWDSLDEGTQNFIVNVGLFAAAVGPFLTTLGKIATAYGEVKKILEVLPGLFKDAKKGFEDVADNLTHISHDFDKENFLNPFDELNRTMEEFFNNSRGTTTATEIIDDSFKTFEKTFDNLSEKGAVAGETFLRLSDNIVDLTTDTDKLVDSYSSISEILDSTNPYIYTANQYFDDFVYNLGRTSTTAGEACTALTLYKEVVDVLPIPTLNTSSAVGELNTTTALLPSIVSGATGVLGLFSNKNTETTGTTDLLETAVHLLEDRFDNSVPLISTAADVIGDVAFEEIGAQNETNLLGGAVQLLTDDIIDSTNKSEVFGDVLDYLPAPINNSKTALSVLEDTMGGYENVTSASEIVTEELGGALGKTSDEAVIGNASFKELGEKGINFAGLKMIAIIAVIALVIAAIVDLWRNNEEFRENIAKIWNSIKETIEAVWQIIKPIFQALLDVFMALVRAIEPFIEKLVETLVPVMESIARIAKALVPIITPLVELIGGALVDAIELLAPLLKIVLKVLEPFLDLAGTLLEIVAGIFEFIAGIVEMIKNSTFGKMLSGAGDFVKAFWNKVLGFDLFSGSHKDGLAYVPYDGYVAQLHKGERVLTAEENRQYSNGVSTGSGTTINFYSNEKIDEYTAARELRRTMKDMELGLV